MPRTLRTTVACAAALVVVAAAWLRLEHPVAPLWRPAALVSLALAAAVPRRGWWRVGTAIAATYAAVWIAFDVSVFPSRPLDVGGAFGLSAPLSTVATQVGDGFRDFYGTHLPFDPRVHTAMGGLVLAAIFCFALLVALLAAARRPVAAALALLAGAGWPATLLGPSHGIAMGAAILGAELVLLAGLGSRRIPRLALPAAAAVAAAAVAVGSATAAGHGLVGWQSWDPTHAAAGPVNVGFVWTPQYGGLDWPAHKTPVLDVQAARPPAYVRAAVLDDFAGEAWGIGPPRSADALEPPAAFQRRHQTREVVTVESLADTHLVGGSIPIRFAAGAAPILEPEPGFAILPVGLAPGFRYTVWSYSPEPTAADLRRVPPAYPAELLRQGMLAVGDGVQMPPFGAPNRAETVQTLQTRNPPLNQYVPLARLAGQVAGRARTPYGAVADLERWFLFSGGFRYSNHPAVVAPPLVNFVTRTRAGYCQFFAGAMALMLRYLGIPARVAVGFAGGTYDTHRWTFHYTDRDAHAWVEVWFPGYGWLPFDPTPAAPGATRNPSASLAHASAGPSYQLPTPGLLTQAAAKNASSQARTRGGHKGLIRPGGRAAAIEAAAVTPASSGGNAGAALLILLVIALALAGIPVSKLAVRTARRRRHDPRQVAAACREELAAFLADQQVEAASSATLHELGDVLRREFGIDASGFVAAATAARFGRADRAEVAARDARRELQVLIGSMKRGLTVGERLRGLFSLRSLGRSGSVAAARSASLGSEVVGSTAS